MQHVYDPQKEEKEQAILQLRLQQKRYHLFTGPLRLDVSFFMPIPASLSFKKQQALKGVSHDKRPDLSNLIKFVEDVAQGTLFRDDSQIVVTTARKIYSDWPRTELIIFEESDEKEDDSNEEKNDQKEKKSADEI